MFGSNVAFMSLFQYPGSNVWTMDFVFRGQRVRESTKTTNRALAKKIEDKRRRELEEGSAGIKKAASPKLFAFAAKSWIEMKATTLAPKSIKIAELSLKHLNPIFGRKLVCDIVAEDIALYQRMRLREEAAPKSINLEVGTLRSVLRRSGHWAALLPNFAMLPVPEDVGIQLTVAEVDRLVKACRESTARPLAPFVILALETGARYTTIRLLQWKNVNLEDRCLQWGKDKTKAGSYRMIPLNTKATAMLSLWASSFPERTPDHYVFPTETGRVLDPTMPVIDNKTAWRTAKRRAKVKCRFHDLRHTAVSRMLDGGAPMAKVAKIVGWSPSTTIKMVSRYAHFSLDQMRSTVEMMSAPHS